MIKLDNKGRIISKEPQRNFKRTYISPEGLLARGILPKGGYDALTGKGSQQIHLTKSQFKRAQRYLESLDPQIKGSDFIGIYDFGIDGGLVSFITMENGLKIDDLDPDICRGLLSSIRER